MIPLNVPVRTEVEPEPATTEFAGTSTLTPSPIVRLIPEVPLEPNSNV